MKKSVIKLLVLASCFTLLTSCGSKKSTSSGGGGTCKVGGDKCANFNNDFTKSYFDK